MWFDLLSLESTKITKKSFWKFILYVKISFFILNFFLLKLLDQKSNLFYYHYLFDNFIIWNNLFSKIEPYFCRLMIKWTQAKIFSRVNILGKNQHLVACTTLCAKSEFIQHCKICFLKNLLSITGRQGDYLPVRTWCAIREFLLWF